MALKLSLKPGEKFVVNGAVIANGDRRASLIIQNKVSILREKDIMTEDEVNTPVRRIYFPIMLMYMDPAGSERYYQEFVIRMSEFMSVIDSAEARIFCVEVSTAVMAQSYYHALMVCRKLLTFEQERLAHVP